PIRASHASCLRTLLYGGPQSVSQSERAEVAVLHTYTQTDTLTHTHTHTTHDTHTHTHTHTRHTHTHNTHTNSSMIPNTLGEKLDGDILVPYRLILIFDTIYILGRPNV